MSGSSAPTPGSRAAVARRPARDLLALAALWAVLFVLYKSALGALYYGFDEGWYVREGAESPLALARYMLLHRGLFNGRPLSYAVWGLQLGIGTTPAGLEAIRVLLFVMGGTMASAFYAVLRRRRVPVSWALLLVLLVWSQPVFQIYYAVSLRTTYWIGVASSVWAFFVLRRARPGGGWPARSSLAAAAGLLMISWTTFQATPFCGLAVLAFYTLRCEPARWPAERRAHLAYVAVLLVTMVVYVAGYKVLHDLGEPEKTYALADRVLSAVGSASLPSHGALLRWTSWAGPFEWWNYPWAVAPLSAGRYLGLTRASAVAWLAILVLAAAREGRQALGRYAVAVAAVALTFLPLVADGFSERQNPYVACVPALVLTLAHGLSVIVRPLWRSAPARRLLTAAAWVVLAFVCAGARRGFERGLVGPNVRFYASVVEQVRRQATSDFTRILVVTTPPTCPDEPCRGVFGYRASLATRRDLPQFYRRVVRDATGRAGVPVVFTDAVAVTPQERAGSLVITFDGLVT